MAYLHYITVSVIVLLLLLEKIIIKGNAHIVILPIRISKHFKNIYILYIIPLF